MTVPSVAITLYIVKYFFGKLRLFLKYFFAETKRRGNTVHEAFPATSASACVLRDTGFPDVAARGKIGFI